MATHTGRITLETRGEVEIVDITERVEDIVRDSGIKEGIALVFVPGSTGAITTIEYEPGLLQDLPDALERLFPKDMVYQHHERWHDGNGHSHVRASFMKPDLCVPISSGSLELGTWQQIVFVELDNKPRRRNIIVNVVGE
jgi:secondary thiamine-phosphate synthase enzyme